MDKRISFLKKQIAANPKNNWTLEELAKKSNLAKSQLVKLFQLECQLSPIHYVREVRLEKACEFLETSFLRVKEIMFAVGISDQSHFVRDFKKKYGFTPTEYRNNYHQRLEVEETACQQIGKIANK